MSMKIKYLIVLFIALLVGLLTGLLTDWGIKQLIAEKPIPSKVSNSLNPAQTVLVASGEELVQSTETFPTLTPATLTATTLPSATPIVDPYDYDGIQFDVVTEDVIGNAKFSKGDEKNVVISLEFPDGQIIEIEFLPIRYFDWMGDNFDLYCPVGSYKGCIFASDGNLTIGLHSGCAPRPLPGEELRVHLEGKSLCDIPSLLTDEEYKKRQEIFRKVSATISGSDIVDDLIVLKIFNIDKERAEEVNYSSSYLFTQSNLEIAADERVIIIIISGREKGADYPYSADRWLVFFGRKN